MKFTSQHPAEIFTLETNQATKTSTQRIPPLRNADHIWARSDNEKENTFSVHLEKTFRLNDLLQHEDLETEINKALKESLQLTQPTKFLTPKEIQNIIQKEMSREGFAHLTTICNGIIRMGNFPAQRKVVQIIMIPNPGKPQ
jgi:hypothetical protein